MHPKNDKILLIINDKANKVGEELFESLRNRYQNNLQESMKDSEFVFSYVDLVYCKCHKMNLNCVGSLIDSPDWIKSKKSKLIPINKKVKNPKICYICQERFGHSKCKLKYSVPK